MERKLETAKTEWAEKGISAVHTYNEAIRLIAEGGFSPHMKIREA